MLRVIYRRVLDLGLKVGMKVKGVVTGIQPYGVFVDLGNQNQGLIHISECQSGYVEDINQLFSVGETVSSLIIDIDEYTGKISLSTRSNSVNYEVFKQSANGRFSNHHYWTNYRLNIGFSTLSKRRSEWMEDAKDFF
ncbi:MAG: CvfD/Ygs/GSP13 family RNA-binding post-transcriptional regulator [Lentilactobacillus hilgardii]|uniref:CvfD/Ygs/GSP13 family RNA-binding post-transcriptional regulator n=1 Tax=Lentilactobacillus hilgardii TaxID=1588 RepID=UPI001CC1F76B|nr:CvfD/Ygs/GSP13 family RNA-binding post-transcriptional regulator [Lentilactobacillus hilgardii]MCI1923400.1 CvfD/Ygs/GSP13 family RNA-binding post-transcriptional regulator [Lentilactobacillus buchneri]MBZ2202568.1 general stress protein [Lentilactobacillus hilgardii]MBZ2205517.1 general stress protein [Lentilactobacillus hilgardii]MCI1951095.1 CvfD/Ygs/GSP13 family RNA-binding post-transcriptional regulator [Lentilactobacillus buchneri]MCI2019744.1 CvfD/Ygs/GSP13 family RNA-binding post-tr